MKHISLLLVLSFLISSCGSESTPQSNETPVPTESNETPVLTELDENSTWPGLETNTAPDSYGYLLDSAVEGLRYTSGGHYGVTGSDGKFGYIFGENIEFYIGNSLIAFANTPRERLTPYEFSNESPFGMFDVLRLLQSLDDDGDPNNGIQITEAVHELAESVVIEPLTFSFVDYPPGTPRDFINPDAILELTSVTMAGPRGVVTAFDAYNHFESTLNSLIDELENDIQSVADEMTCVSSDQCDFTVLGSSYTSYCPSPGAPIIYSKNDLDQMQQFDALVADREYLNDVRKSFEYPPDNITGICIIQASPIFLVCNASNRCEIEI